MAQQIAIDRLTQERKNWRKDHPAGFYARPMKQEDSMNMLEWEFGIPGKKGTDWEGGLYKGTIKFPSNFPFSAPVILFKPVIYHPNVYADGKVCVSFISSWNPSFTMKQIMVGLQDLLNDPNPKSPANRTAADQSQKSPKEYSARIKLQAKKFGEEDAENTVKAAAVNNIERDDVIVL